MHLCELQHTHAKLFMLITIHAKISSSHIYEACQINCGVDGYGKSIGPMWGQDFERH